MTNGKSLAAWAETQIGTPYDKMDCMDLVTEGIRRAEGADGESLGYRCGGCNELWRSIHASGKYRYVTRRLGLDTARTTGALRSGALLVIWEPGYNEKYDDDEGDCSHIGVYVGREGCEVIHSSKSRGMVCVSTLKNGWTHMLEHRLIDLEDGDAREAEYVAVEDAYTAMVCTQKDPLTIREKPDAGSRAVGKVKKGKEVTVVGEAKMDGEGREWLPVEASEGVLRGWACATYLKAAEKTPPDMVNVPRSEILALADALTVMDDNDGAFNAKAFFDGVEMLQDAARAIAKRLKGDD